MFTIHHYRHGHKGWRIYEDYSRGGIYTAERYGVSMCHPVLSELIRMVEARVSARSRGESYV